MDETNTTGLLSIIR